MRLRLPRRPPADMFIGHFAPAFVAAAVSPERPRLGMMFVAAQLVDWAFFALSIIGRLGKAQFDVQAIGAAAHVSEKSVFLVPR